MRKRNIVFLTVSFVVLAALVASTIIPQGYASHPEEEWYAFGKDQHRTRNSLDTYTVPPLGFRWKIEGIGWSISQSVMDGQYIYHIAKGNLYRIPIDLGFYDWNTTFQDMAPELIEKGYSYVKISNDPRVWSHPTIDAIYSKAGPRIYAGTGDGKVVKVNPVTMEILRSYDAGPDVRIVNAPTVLGDDLIAFGGDDSKIYVAKGPNVAKITYNPDGHPAAEITGTYSQLPDVGGHPVIVVPVSYRGVQKAGYVGAFQVIDHGDGQAPSVKLLWQYKTLNGVAASITYDAEKNRIYFADKSGTVYALNASNGKEVWKNTKFRSSSSMTTMVNNSPALHGDILVIPIRYHKGRERGVVAAFSTVNGQNIWAVTSQGLPYESGKFSGEIANAPVILNTEDALTGKQGKSYVLFGTTKGYLRTVNLKTGEREVIAHDAETGEPQYYIEAVHGKGGSFYQGRGLATETMVGGGLIVFGANDADLPNGDGTNGTLYAYSAKPLERPDLAALDLRVNPVQPIVGDQLQLDVQVENSIKYNWREPITTRLSWKSNYSDTYTTDYFTLNAGAKPWVTGLQLPAIPETDDGHVTVWTKINPTEREPANEVTYENNVLEKKLMLYCGDDFYIKSVEGGRYFKGQEVTTKVVVGRKAGASDDAQATVRLYIKGDNLPLPFYRLYNETVTLAPGEEKPVFITWEADFDPGSHTLMASINEDLKHCERDFTNNFMEVGVTILEKLSPPMCTWGESRPTSGITDQWEHCPDDGDCHWHYYYEYLSADIIGLEAIYVEEDAPYEDPDPPIYSVGTGNRVKAGQGFAFKVRTKYEDESGKYDGPYTVYAVFADGTRVELEPERPRGSWTNTWILPTSWVEKRTGERLYDFPGDPGADWVSGGRAHYTDQYTPDGGYPFKVVVTDAGKNNLSLCLEAEVEVSGSVWDDFYVRRVNPERPFVHRDGEPTSLWEEHMHLFDGLEF